MNIRFTTVEGAYRVLAVTEVEIDPIANTDMYSHDGKILIKERPKEKKRGIWNGRKG